MARKTKPGKRFSRPGEKRLKTVYKQTAVGVKRMKGVRFDTERSKIRTD